MVGGVVLNSAFVEDHFNKKPVEFFDAEADQQLGEKLQDVINWILTDAADSHFIQSVGGAMVVMGPLAWGYGYSMTYFLFLEAADPGCGSLDRDDVYNKYVKPCMNVVESLM